MAHLGTKRLQRCRWGSDVPNRGGRSFGKIGASDIQFGVRRVGSRPSRELSVQGGLSTASALSAHTDPKPELHRIRHEVRHRDAQVGTDLTRPQPAALYLLYNE